MGDANNLNSNGDSGGGGAKMKHKKEKKDKNKKKGRTSLLSGTQRGHQHSASQHSSTLGSSSGQLDQTALQSAYRWEKLSPAEFEQLQDLASCKFPFMLATPIPAIRYMPQFSILS